MPSLSRRLIPKDLDCEQSLHELASQEYWLLSEWVQPDPDQQVPGQVIWETEDRATKIHLVQDFLVQFPYLIVAGSDTDSVTQILTDNIPLYTDEELLQGRGDVSSLEERKMAVARLGVGAPRDYDIRFFEQLRLATGDQEPEVRSVAIWVMGYPSWPQFRPLLEKLRDHDSDAEVRDDARVILASFDHHNIR